MAVLFFIVLMVAIPIYFAVQDKKNRDAYDPSYLKDLYNGTLNQGSYDNDLFDYHHSYSSSSRSYSSGSHRRSSRSSSGHSRSGRGGGGRSGGGGAGRR